MNEDDLGWRDVASRRAKQGFALFAIVAGFFLVLEAEFGDRYRRYASVTPRFFPRWSSSGFGESNKPIS